MVGKNKGYSVKKKKNIESNGMTKKLQKKSNRKIVHTLISRSSACGWGADLT